MRLIDADRINYDIFRDDFGTRFVVIRIDDLSQIPTVDAEPVRHGKWIEKEVIGGINSLTFKVEKYKIYKCYLCRFEVMSYPIKYKYCPDCGAKMTEECDDE